ncbi:MAG TPA: NAD-dependent epimerase/dehydratase family protein [Methylomirabilota bacterium]|nr:NAD-dependent epimerase/dehydratase family protein [Methylomirabilota bacterium]
MRVGVIGGAGFIGSHVVDKLLDAGHDVTVFDIMRPHRPDVRHVVADILDASRTTVALAGRYDALYLLAAISDVNDVFHIPVESAQVNIMAVGHVLEAARRTGAGRVILASTTWVYALADPEEVDEDTPLRLNRVNHVYTASKLSAEMLCHSYHTLYGVDTTILRYGIPYGPRARLGTVLASFVALAMQGRPIVIQGDGTQWRSLVAVEDLALGNVAALQEAARNQTYNLDGPERIEVRRVAEKVRQFFPDVQIQHTEKRPGDLRPKVVSSRKALAELGWKPEITFEEGAERYIKWVEQSALPWARTRR